MKRGIFLSFVILLIISVSSISAPSIPDISSLIGSMGGSTPDISSLIGSMGMPSLPNPFGSSGGLPSMFSWWSSGGGSTGCRSAPEYVTKQFTESDIKNYVAGCSMFPSMPSMPSMPSGAPSLPTMPTIPGMGNSMIEASTTSADQFCKEKGYEKSCSSTTGSFFPPIGNCIYYYSGGWQIRSISPFDASYYSSISCDKRACSLETCSSRGYECGSFTDACGKFNNCGDSCTSKFSNAVGVCSNFVCSISKCSSGYSNCNNLLTDGCESNLNLDNSNCGKCGVKCNTTSTINPTMCVNGNCIAVAEPYLANMKEVKITQTDLNDLVKLMLVVPQGANLNLQSNTLQYEVYKDIKWWFDSRVAQGANKGYTTWRAGKKSDGTLEAGKYYFKIKVGNQWFQSSNLVVKDEEKNSPPVVIITSPSENNADKARYKIGEQINFSARFEDEDDDLRAIWDFGDGVIENYENCSTGNDCNPKHIYSNKGTKVITLNAEEIERKQTSYDYSRTFIYDRGTNMFAVINSPAPGAALESRIVNFDASGSYVSFCDYSCYTGKTCYPIGDLQCYNIDEPRVYGNYDLKLDWTFSDKITKSGRWTEIFNEIVVFKKEFFTSTKTKNRADLKISIIGGDNATDNTFTSFYIKDNSAVCNATQRESNWLVWQGDKLISQNSTDECVRGGRTCCPLISSCNLDSGKCSRPHFDYCWNYTSKEECGSYSDDVAIDSVNIIKGSGFCGSSIADANNSNCRYLISDCGCKWNSNDSTCTSTFDKIQSCHYDKGDSQEVGSCEIAVSKIDGDCSKGDEYMTYTWINEWVCDASVSPTLCEGYRNPECEENPKQKTITCARITKLSFFNWVNVIIAIFILIGIYFLLLKRKK